MMSVKGQAWFEEPQLQTVLALLNSDGGEARVVGGAVRNALMGLPVADHDIATTLRPGEVVVRAKKAGIKCVPTGLTHGTVTLVIDSIPFEVTTLRLDVATDGRHAEVVFTGDWKLDAERRDFTINALYADMSGQIHDDVGGIKDIESRTIRFIGKASERIAEDHLRILRFFRFFAYYGSGRPDAEGLKACAVARDSLKNLSAERVWAELKKLFSAPDPGRALLWMRTTGVLTVVLPETEKWGIDAMGGLIAAEKAFRWPVDPMLRLAAIVPPDQERLAAMADRLRLSRREAAVLTAFASAPAIGESVDHAAFARLLYQHGIDGIATRLKLMMASEREKSEAADLTSLKHIHRLSDFLEKAQTWQRPVFPVTGSDLMSLGIPQGPDLGQKLAELEARWIEADFKMGKADLLAMV